MPGLLHGRLLQSSFLPLKVTVTCLLILLSKGQTGREEQHHCSIEAFSLGAASTRLAVVGRLHQLIALLDLMLHAAIMQ